MGKKQQKLTTSRISARLEKIRPLQVHAEGISGWISYLQDALAMTSVQLAKRLGISAPSLIRLKQREKTGGISLGQLRKVASALESELVYVFIPKMPVEKIMQMQAEQKATHLLKKANVQMELENQGLTRTQQDEQLRQWMEDLLFTKDLWEE